MKHTFKRSLLSAVGLLVAVPMMLAVVSGERSVTKRGYRVGHGMNTPAAVRSIGLEVDSVMFRDDVTRVYGKITGPHNTSARIDRITLTQGKQTYVSDDIDGFDYERAFQWEEDGVIPVEIDFAPITGRPDSFVITAETPRGNCVWSVFKRR